MPSTEQPSFGALLRHYRVAAGLTQEALADLAGLSTRAISDLERGVNRTARISTLGLLADALRLGPEARARLLGASQPVAEGTSARPAIDGEAVTTRQRAGHNLPADATPLIGRTQEAAVISALLQQPGTRLVTLIGSGGVGKTRLALHVAASQTTRHVDGTWLIDLATVRDPSQVPRAVAATLGLLETVELPSAAMLAAALRRRAMVLVLDSCEHLIDACAALVAALMRDCPDLRILATSREGLAVQGETTYRVPPLAVPDPDQLPGLDQMARCEAVQLFLARARTRRADFALTAENAQAIARICARLDGLPLAIELAAGRLGVLEVEGIAARLDDCLRLLAGGPRTVPPRLQSLRATLDWSHDLLSERERVLLRRLSAFACAWTLEAAESVCAGGEVARQDVLELLGTLVAKSLVQVEERAGAARYRLLETVRQYAAERLRASGEEEQLRLPRHQTLGFYELAFPAPDPQGLEMQDPPEHTRNYSAT